MKGSIDASPPGVLVQSVFLRIRRMFFRRRFLASGIILPAIMMVFSNQVHGMQLQRPFEEIAREADVVFVGIVVHQEAEWGDRGKMIFTHVHFLVEQVIHNPSGLAVSEGETLVLPFAGGQIAGREMSVSDVPVFRNEVSYILFARMDGKRYASPTVSGSQGVFRVVRDEQTGRRYPLNNGRAISSVSEGKLIRQGVPSRIRNQIADARQDRWHERRLGVAPEPAMEMGRAHADVARPEMESPGEAMTLEEFIDEIRKQIGIVPAKGVKP